MAAELVPHDGHPETHAGVTGWLEILDRTGKVARRFPLGAEPLHIGRAYDNDIVLDDPYVCPHHVRVTWHEGLLRVVDQHSVNGVFFGKQEKRLAEELVGNDGRFRIGRTVMRFRRHDCPLPLTWVDRPLHAPLRLVERPWILVLLYLGVLLYQGLEFYLTSTRKIDQVGLVTDLVALAAVIIGWSALWAFPSRLLMGRWNFLIHCGIASFAIVTLGVAKLLIGICGYALDADHGIVLLTQGVEWLLLGSVLYAHLSYLVAARAGRLMRWAGGITLCLAGLMTLIQYLEGQKFTSRPEFTMTLKAPIFRVRDGAPPETTLQVLDQLRLEADADLTGAGRE